MPILDRINYYFSAQKAPEISAARMDRKVRGMIPPGIYYQASPLAL
jgi:hypothetical protein